MQVDSFICTSKGSYTFSQYYSIQSFKLIFLPPFQDVHSLFAFSWFLLFSFPPEMHKIRQWLYNVTQLSFPEIVENRKVKILCKFCCNFTLLMKSDYNFWFYMKNNLLWRLLYDVCNCTYSAKWLHIFSPTFYFLNFVDMKRRYDYSKLFWQVKKYDSSNLANYLFKNDVKMCYHFILI